MHVYTTHIHTGLCECLSRPNLLAQRYAVGAVRNLAVSRRGREALLDQPGVCLCMHVCVCVLCVCTRAYKIERGRWGGGGGLLCVCI